MVWSKNMHFALRFFLQIKLKELETATNESAARQIAQSEEQYKMLEADNKHFQVSRSKISNKKVSLVDFGAVHLTLVTVSWRKAKRTGK